MNILLKTSGEQAELVYLGSYIVRLLPTLNKFHKQINKASSTGLVGRWLVVV